MELLRGYVDRRAFEKERQNFEEWSEKTKSLARRLRSIAPKARELLIYLDPEFVESLSQTADNVEKYPELVAEMKWGDPFGRSFAGTACFLVLGVKLIEKSTGKPHYREVADIITCIASATPGTSLANQGRSEGAIRKAVKGFVKRQSEFVTDFLQSNKVETSAKVWIRRWRSAEQRLTVGSVLGRSKTMQ